MIIIEEHIVPEGNYHIRIQEYAGKVFTQLQTRSAVKKAIAQKRLLIDKKPAQTSDWIVSGQHLALREIDQSIKKVFYLDLEIIYEDESIAVIKKPSGYPTNGNYFKTIENALPHNLTPSTLPDALRSARPVHRLDTATSGLLIIAKSKGAQIALHLQFENKEVTKTYQAVIAGTIDNEGTIETPINDQSALTTYRCIRRIPSIQNQWLSLVELYPKTGRTHQLRIHLSSRSTPIVGDKLYAPANVMKHKGLFLCATKLAFKHPTTGASLCFKIDTPKKFTSYLNREERRYNKHFQ